MIPYSYSTKGDTITFHYRFADWREYLTEGKKCGCTGPVLIKIEGKMLRYRTFGTYENPFKEMYRMNLIHHPAFDGPMVPADMIAPYYNEDLLYPWLKDLRIFFLNDSDSKQAL